MVKQFLISCLFVLPLLTAGLSGQTLISQLPEDGVWATYDIEAKTIRVDRETETFFGELTIRMVGTEIQDQETLRWIEIEQNFTRAEVDVRIVDILLVPESAVGDGKDLVANLQKMWRYHSASDKEVPTAYELDSNATKTLNTLFPKPFDKVKKTEIKEIETEIGSFECEGRVGISKLMEGASATDMDRLLTVFSHKDAPFGSVTMKQIVKTRSNDEELFTMVATMKLKEKGTDAVSAFPDFR